MELLTKEDLAVRTTDQKPSKADEAGVVTTVQGKVLDIAKVVKSLGLSRFVSLARAKRLAWEEIISGYFTTRAMSTMFNVGVFDHIRKKGYINLSNFADANRLDAEKLNVLCDYLFALKILKKHPDGYALEKKGKILTHVARGWFDLVYGYEDLFHNLDALVRGEKRYGTDFHRNGEFVAKGSGEIEKWFYFPLAREIIEKKGFRNLLDLGCGDGTFLRMMCEGDEYLTGFGIDLSVDAIKLGIKIAIQKKLNDRIFLLAEDISNVQRLPESFRKIDSAITFFVLHEILAQGLDDLIKFLKRFRSFFPDVPLIVFEAIRARPEELRKRSGPAAQYALFHHLSNQRLVGRKRWRSIFKDAGFQSIHERYIDMARTSIFTLQ